MRIFEPTWDMSETGASESLDSLVYWMFPASDNISSRPVKSGKAATPYLPFVGASKYSRLFHRGQHMRDSATSFYSVSEKLLNKTLNLLSSLKVQIALGL